MICKQCHRESNSPSRVCPFCGNFLGDEEPRVYDYNQERNDLPRPSPGQEVNQNQKALDKKKRSKQKKNQKLYRRFQINWAKTFLALGILALLFLSGSFIYFSTTLEGQIIMARMGKEASADAYWRLGTDYLDEGSIQKSIDSYLKAIEKDPERKDLPEKLLLLAEAYQAADQAANAEEVYFQVYSMITPKKFEENPKPYLSAYRNAINLMINQERMPEATDLMRLAFEKTKDDSFFNQRSQLVPEAPTATLAGGRYQFNRTVEFVSAQGYEIFYATGDEPLPENGILYTGPILINEGTHSFRAVAVSRELISDEMTVKYTITLPSPLAPKSNMASGDYKQQIKVSLRIVDTDKNVQLYYTIDGTKPTEKSPRYTGTPILMPCGKSILRAVAVNKYGKMSNEMVVKYTVKLPYRKFFRTEDGFADFTLMSTGFEQFTAKFGQPTAQSEIQDEAMTGVNLRAEYPWGEARFTQTDKGKILYRVDTTQSGWSGPRGAKVGMPIKEVTDKFRDMGQVPSENGDRGIYYSFEDGSHAFFKADEDNRENGLLQYLYIDSAKGMTSLFQCRIKGGIVEQMSLQRVGRKLSLVQ